MNENNPLNENDNVNAENLSDYHQKLCDALSLVDRDQVSPTRAANMLGISHSSVLRYYLPIAAVIQPWLRHSLTSAFFDQ